mmetsp:Transcript_24125/g.37046  ORF Transcript_24125/g.37046 Transcript_24125/m.37046 type:complete len:94 (+) Transcript_24125:1-282(+)
MRLNTSHINSLVEPPIDQPFDSLDTLRATSLPLVEVQEPLLLTNEAKKDEIILLDKWYERVTHAYHNFVWGPGDSYYSDYNTVGESVLPFWLM